MCLDVLNQDNYLNINITLVKLLGFQTAAYCAVLCKILGRVKTKSKYDEMGFFKIDRKFVQELTSIDAEDQIACDQKLAKLGVLNINQDDSDKLSIDAQMLLSIIIGGDIDEISEKIKKVNVDPTPKEKKKAKLEGIKSNMKRYITETDSTLYEAYCAWIDVIAESRKINKVIVEQFQKTVDSFTNNKEDKLAIIQISAVRAYTDAHWGISVYKENYMDKPEVVSNQKDKEVNSDVVF